MLAKIGDIKLSYQKFGTGAPIVFIHGYGGNKDFWNPQREISKKFMMITLDLRGTGESSRPNYPYSMYLLVNDIKGLLDYLNLSKAHIVGRSFGGMIAQNFYLTYPNMVDKLILIATNYGRKDKEWVEVAKSGRLEQIDALKTDPYKAFKLQSRWVYHVKFRKEIEANPKKKIHGIFSMEDLIKQSTINPSNPQDIINQAEAMKDHYTYEKLNTIKAETLLIAASHDRQTPLSVMEEIHKQIPNSILKVIQNAGHFMTISRAPEVNRIILDFLEN